MDLHSIATAMVELAQTPPGTERPQAITSAAGPSMSNDSSVIAGEDPASRGPVLDNLANENKPMPVATKKTRRKKKRKFEIHPREARRWLLNATLWSAMARRNSKPQPAGMRDVYLYEYDLIRLHMRQETDCTKEMVAKMEVIADKIRNVRVKDE